MRKHSYFKPRRREVSVPCWYCNNHATKMKVSSFAKPTITTADARTAPTKFVSETGATTSITTLDMDSTIVLGPAGTTSIS